MDIKMIKQLQKQYFNYNSNEYTDLRINLTLALLCKGHAIGRDALIDHQVIVPLSKLVSKYIAIHICITDHNSINEINIAK